MDWAGDAYEVDVFEKMMFFWSVVFFLKIIFFRERVPRGRSRRENCAKILAAAFSRRDFLMSRETQRERERGEREKGGREKVNSGVRTVTYHFFSYCLL